MYGEKLSNYMPKAYRKVVENIKREKLKFDFVSKRVKVRWKDFAKYLESKFVVILRKIILFLGIVLRLVALYTINYRKLLYCFSKYSPLRSTHFCMRLNQLSKHSCHSD